MTINLEAHPAASDGYVTVEAAATTDILTLTRTDTSGSAPVRVSAGLLPVPALVVEDNEAALTGPITYTVATATESATITCALDVDSVWITDPKAPIYTLAITAWAEHTRDRTAQTQIHQIIGRADPLPTILPLTLPAGTMRLWCPDAQAAMALEAALARPVVLMLRQPLAGLDMYFVPGRVRSTCTPENLAPRPWTVDVDYQAVGRPGGDMIGARGRTWATVIAEHSTWLRTQIVYRTWADLITGDTDD